MTDQPDFVDTYIDLAQPRLGASVIDASDDFFAPKERLIKPEPPIFIEDKYDHHGKWLDGWVSLLVGCLLACFQAGWGGALGFDSSSSHPSFLPSCSLALDLDLLH